LNALLPALLHAAAPDFRWLADGYLIKSYERPRGDVDSVATADERMPPATTAMRTKATLMATMEARQLRYLRTRGSP
jgi:hypothetical protein